LDAGQAGQFMHYYDNGLFVGQFGQPLLYGVVANPPGGSGNNYNPSLVEVGTNVYLYHNDEPGAVRIDGKRKVWQTSKNSPRASSSVRRPMAPIQRRFRPSAFPPRRRTHSKAENRVCSQSLAPARPARHSL
jgi:hypothetical protein